MFAVMQRLDRLFDRLLMVEQATRPTSICQFNKAKPQTPLFTQSALICKSDQLWIPFDHQRTHEPADFCLVVVALLNGDEFADRRLDRHATTIVKPFPIEPYRTTTILFVCTTPPAVSR